MNTVLAKTFLAVIEEGSFLSAAKVVHVSQSTVSARVKALEQDLGKVLFVRTKSRCHLTPAGEKFHRFARSMIRVWEEARHQVAVPEGFSHTLFVAGQYSAWNGLLLRWLSEFRQAAPEVAVRCQMGSPERLMRAMADGLIDLAVVYSPEARPGLYVERLGEDQLILVTGDLNSEPHENHVFVHWGAAFRAWHASKFPKLQSPGLTLDLGALSVNHIINEKAAGYFPQRIVQPHIDAGLLHRVSGASEFSYPFYLVYQEEYGSPEVIQKAVALLKDVAARMAAGGLGTSFWA